MYMKIQPTLAPPTSTPTNGAGAKRTATDTGPAAPVDRVQLSPLAAQARTTAASNSFDAEKVAGIKQAIAEGRLTIDTGAVADRLIAEAKALAGRDR
jgi:negative regulator of flagellin synthesis FlgM